MTPPLSDLLESSLAEKRDGNVPNPALPDRHCESPAAVRKSIPTRHGFDSSPCDRISPSIELGDYGQAIQDFDAAIQINPDDYRPFIGRGRAYTKKDDPDRSWADYERADHLKLRRE
jgi:hypothetical protein